ncbi:MAG: SsrA-binding protein SmpB [Patescibacteria group bacterium]
MILIEYRKARAEYEIIETYQAGIVLSGAEVKSIRNKNGSLHGSFVKPVGNELFLVGAQISPYKFSDNKEYDPKRSRKLLLRKREIFALIEASSLKGKALIPLSFELAHNQIKLNFAIAKGKKLYDRRKELKERDIKRETARDLKRGKAW